MARIEIKTERSDPGLLWVGVRIEDATLSFDTQLYAGDIDLGVQVDALEQFRGLIAGGEHALRLGAFGPEYAAGALHAHFAFRERGRLYVTVHAQTGFVEHGGRQVANEVTMHMLSEPVLLDEFVRSMAMIAAGTTDAAVLEGSGAIW